MFYSKNLHSSNKKIMNKKCSKITMAMIFKNLFNRLSPLLRNQSL